MIMSTMRKEPLSGALHGTGWLEPEAAAGQPAMPSAISSDRSDRSERLDSVPGMPRS